MIVETCGDTVHRADKGLIAAPDHAEFEAPLGVALIGFGPVGLDHVNPSLDHLILAAEKRPPHFGRCGDLSKRLTECLNHDPVVITDLFERRGDLFVIDVPAPRRAPVILGKMDVVDGTSRLADGVTQAAFFDIGVERVEQAAVAGEAHVVDQRLGLRNGVEHVALEPVERLDRKLHARIMGHARHLAMTMGQYLQFALCGPRAGEDAQRPMEGPAEQFDARLRAAFYHPFQVIKTGLARRKV